MDFEQDLNPQQREAVYYQGGPLLVLAGAGSGKTRVLTYRICRLILEQNIPPSRILAITFTNKAAEEMRFRVNRLLGPESKSMWLGTFHATCARILRQHIERIGYGRNFVIYDESDQLRVIKSCLKSMNIEDKRLSPVAIKAMLSKAKNQALDPAHFIPPNAVVQDALENIFTQYELQMQQANALDFGDLILLVLKLFEEAPDILDRYQSKFSSILVDEYQDTNRVQHMLLKKLAPAQGGDLCVVGDDDQSIYRWRGAEVKNMLCFEDDFPETVVLTLEQNYRSTQNILWAAEGVARGNPKRREKRLWTTNEPGPPVFYHEATTQEEEARFVSREIQSLFSRGEVSYRDIGVFYRTNAQSRAFEEQFVPFRIPYAVIGSLRFYERAEIKDLLAYSRFLYNQRDSVSLLRILNRPPRGIGPTTQNKLEAYAARLGQPLWEALEQALRTSALPKVMDRKVRHFWEQIHRLHRNLEEDISLPSLMKNIIKITGYKDYLEGQPDGEKRQENTDELLRTIVQFEQSYRTGHLRERLGAFCERISLITNVDDYDGRGNCVSLMTLHCAKGLEFPIVFLTGMEDGIMPHQRSCLMPEDLAEERRLCYVGMTRAKNKLFLSRSMTRVLYGERQTTRPCPFLSSIPSEVLQAPGGQDPLRQTAWPELQDHTQEAYPAFHPSHPLPNLPSHPVQPGPDQKPLFRVGDRIEHESLGEGTVRNVENQGGKEKIIVDFDHGKIRKFMARHAPIIKL